MFDSVDTANDCIRIATGVLSTIAINPERMLAGLSADMLATDLAEYLVRKGAPKNPNTLTLYTQLILSSGLLWMSQGESAGAMGLPACASPSV